MTNDKQRERLVELLKETRCERSCDGFKNIEVCNGCTAYERYAESADSILADGWMRPPCKVGDVVYSIQGFNGKPEQCEPYEVDDITIYANTITIHIRDEWLFVRNIYPDDIGKTVFLTKEEAEKALRKEG